MHTRAILGLFASLSLSLFVPACNDEAAEPETGVAMSGLTTASIAVSDYGHFTGRVDLPAGMDVRTATSGCSNSGGPEITLEGEIKLGGFKANIVLQNNTKGTHTASQEVEGVVEILQDGQKIVIPKQPSRGGVGGNPHIYVQFYDSKGGQLGSEVYLGRCNDAGKSTHIDFSMISQLDARMVTGNCYGSGGPNITLEGELALRGIKAKLIFQNNLKGTHTAEVKTEVDLVLLQDGQKLTFAKSPAKGGAGGNPLIYVQFLDDKGTACTDKFFLGRCNQLGR